MLQPPLDIKIAFDREEEVHIQLCASGSGDVDVKYYHGTLTAAETELVSEIAKLVEKIAKRDNDATR